MTLLLCALGVFAGSGLLALLTTRFPRISTFFGTTGAVLGCALGLAPTLAVLGGGPPRSLLAPWDVPHGSFHIELDALSAWFVLPILVLCALAAVYGSQYMIAHAGHKALGPHWFFFNLLIACMVLVVVARNGLLFLFAWEGMSLASFFLVVFEDEKEAVREAGWTYLVAMHLGTAFLLVLFLLLGQRAGSLEFKDFAAPAELSQASASLLFLLALVGFGTKAGFLPLHVWLPEAHPAAPSHVSAVMSGVMIKTGIYGLIRVLTFLGPPLDWWAWLLIGIGFFSGVLGILWANPQRDLKRLLAYSSVENVGIIGMGLGVGLWGLSARAPTLAVLGFAGALLHVVNHALFKGLLFLGAGCVIHGADTAELDRLGGLLKRMPWAGVAFLTGAVAICGLPPLNGFAGEFLIYLGAFKEEMSVGTLTAIPPLTVIAGLALIGGLAAACFTKAFGIVFLGQPRSAHAAEAHPPGLFMLLPMVLLAGSCVLVGIFSPRIVAGMTPVLGVVLRQEPAAVAAHLAPALAPLSSVVIVSSVFFVLLLFLVALRARLLLQRPVAASETWGCGYARPTPHMQYTSSSFAQPLTGLFQPLLRTRIHEPALTHYFPHPDKLATETPEIWREAFYQPLFRTVGQGLSRLRWLQQGRVQLYVLYIALTIFFLLVWYMGLTP